jgi:hypothetical protein
VLSSTGRGHGVPLVVVAVQQPRRSPAPDLSGELPAEVDGVLDPEVEPLTADRRVDVRGVAGQQHSAGAVPLGQPRAVAEPGQPSGRVHPPVGPGPAEQLPPELVEAGRGRAVLGHALGRHEHPVPAVLHRRGAEPELPGADLGHRRGELLRRDVHLHLAEQRVDPVRLAGEPDAEQPADGAPPAVAADQVLRPQARPVSQRGGHPAVVLDEVEQGAAPTEHRSSLDRMLLQQPVGDGLGEAQHVRVRRPQALRRQRRLADMRERPDQRVPLPSREEPVRQAALVEHLDAAGVQPQGPDVRHRLGVPLQHQHLDPVQPQLAGQHRAGRTAPHDDHVAHCPPPVAASDRRLWRVPPGLPQAPLSRRT